MCGAPSWVYINQSRQAGAEAMRAHNLASMHASENEKCQKRLQLLKSEISKLESTIMQLKDTEEINSKTLDKIILGLNEFKKILNSA